MEINITSLAGNDQFPLSHLRAEGGQDAGAETWAASMEAATETPLLDTEEKLQAFRDWLKPSGGWDAEEIATMTDHELNGLFLQWVAGDCRECPAKLEGVEFEERFPGMWYFQTPKDKAEGMEDGPHNSRHEAYQVASNEVVGYNQTQRADSLEDIDWQEYEKRAEAGQCSSNIYRTEEGLIFFNLCH